MPQQLSGGSQVGLAPLKKTLRIRITILIILLVAALTGSIAFIYNFNHSQTAFFLTLIVAILLSSLMIFLVWRFLKPLEVLYEGAQILAKGELDHRINIHSSDEIEFISYSLNTLAQNLSQTFQKTAQDRDYIISEKNKLDTIISSIIDGVIVLDLHNQVILANDSAARMTGYKFKEMLGQSIDDLTILKDKEGHFLNLKECCRLDTSGAPHQSKFTSTLIGKNQQEVQVDITISPIREGLQANLGCIIILHDVTQDKLLQQMQIDFVSMASHEIRTPLTIITSYLSILETEGKEQLKPELREFLSRALTSSRQLAVLVDNMLNVSKIERNSFSVSLQLLDWRKNLIQVVENNRAQAIQKNISLKLNIPNELPLVMADEIRINEVLNNLINNALAYTKEGGIVEVGSKISGNELITYVSDNGVGIPKEALSHLFTKFFRVAGSLDKGSKGTGLGLYISKSIMDLHHGQIWVNSEINKGSTFYFSLPINNLRNQIPTITKLHASLT